MNTALQRSTPTRPAQGLDTVAGVLVLALASALALTLAGCQPANSTSAPVAPGAATTAASTAASAPVKAAAVRVEKLQPAPLLVALSLTGSVEATRVAQVSSPAEGPVQRLRVREGDAVAAGQVLLQLGRTGATQAVAASARADLKKEEDNLARTQRLVALGALPAEQEEAARAAVLRVRSQLARADEVERDSVITAPWAGVVTRTRVTDGDVVAPRAPLIELHDPSSLVVRVAVPEAAATSLSLGMQASVQLDAHGEQRWPARVSRLSPTLDARTHSRTVELTLQQPPALLPGMFARVQIVQRTVPDALTVPANALVAVPGGAQAVFVAVDQKAQRRTVALGGEFDGRWLVQGGLKPGDQVIVAGHEALKDGAAVKVVPAAKAATAAGAPTPGIPGAAAAASKPQGDAS